MTGSTSKAEFLTFRLFLGHVKVLLDLCNKLVLILLREFFHSFTIPALCRSCLYITDGMKNSSFFGIMCIQNGLINNRKTYRKDVVSTLHPDSRVFFGRPFVFCPSIQLVEISHGSKIIKEGHWIGFTLHVMLLRMLRMLRIFCLGYFMSLG